jgi:arylsulfatase A-like enzyme
MDDNKTGPLPLEEITIAERLKTAGYVTGQVGKWHLEPLDRSPAPGDQRRATKDPSAFYPHAQGFDEYFCGTKLQYLASHDLQGHPLPNAPAPMKDPRFRVDVQTEAALSFIERHAREPFFLYLAWFAPHVPLEAPEKYLARFPGPMAEQRRLALAMVSAMDDGVGRIRDTLRAKGIDRNTLVFFLSDNGAPLKQGNWDGSLNLPLLGEKGMLTDGGSRIPFLAAWPGVLPAGKVYQPPVISLDVAATAIAAAGLPPAPILDGVNLVPFLSTDQANNPHDALFWRWRGQAAIRTSQWKLVLLGTERRYLFDLNSPEAETKNRIADFPNVAGELEQKLKSWCNQLTPPGLPQTVVEEDRFFFATHVDKTLSLPSKPTTREKNRNKTVTATEPSTN